MQFYFDPLDVACKSVIGGVKEREILQLNIYCVRSKENSSQIAGKRGIFYPKTPDYNDCMKPENNAFLRLNRDGEEPALYPMKITEFGWTIALSFSEIGLYFYSFIIENAGNIACGYLETGYFTTSEHVNGFLLTVSSADYRTPEWFKGGVMYQIFPDRFCKVGDMPVLKGRMNRNDWGGTPSFLPNKQGKVLNNDFFGGNFKGMESKLSYLQSLGVTVIYLNPIFEAASNHRYDTSDYKKIDPMLGTEEDFASLVDAAKKAGIRVILDGVFNHTGDNSVYFNKYGEYPTVGAYQSQDSPYFSWYTFHQFPHCYNSWWGIDILPEVNESSEDYQNFIFGKDGVLKKWLGFGIGGYRLDVADELPDFFLKKLRKSVKEEDEDAIIIGEVWEDASNKIAYSQRREYLQGYELDSVMNYPLKDGIIAYMQTGNALALAHCIRVLRNHYPKESLDCLMNILGTHDTARILTVLGGIQCLSKEEMAQDWAYLNDNARKKAIEKLKMAAVLQFTVPGVPCIYYGDENGMEGHIDPFCRRCFDWAHLNEDLIAFYRKLGEIREEYREIFKDGDFKELRIEESLFLYKRTKKDGDVYVCTNNSFKSYILNLPETYKDCFSGKIYENELLIEPYSYKIFVKADKS